jgi:PKD repeat protein
MSVGLICGALILSGCEDLPNIPPTAVFIYSPVAPIYAGQTSVVFNASLSRDSDGSIVLYHWNFGDNSAEVNTDQSIVTHVFTDTSGRCLEATYTVLLIVTDDKQGTTAASQQVKVIELPAPGSVECQPPKTAR